MKNTVFADLHVHSTASDGVLTPFQLVSHADEIGLKVMAVTDHDTLDGIEEARIAAKDKDIEIISGIELSCGWEGRDSSIHVLGLFLVDDAGPLKKLLEEQQISRYKRAFRILDLLEDTGIDTQELKDDFLKTPERILGRPHIARFLQEKGHINFFQEAFDKYLAYGKPAYVPKDHLAPMVGINAIHEAGGIAVLAHPGLVPDWATVWSRISEMPWDGFEIYYSEHSPKQIRFFEELAENKNWLSTGGSDYHGEYGKHADRLGKYGLNEEQYKTLTSGVEARRAARSGKEI